MRSAAGAAVLLTLAWALPGAAQAPSPAPSPAQLAPGDVVPAFDAEGVDGVMHHVGYGKEPTDPQWHDTPEYKEWLDKKKAQTTVDNRQQQ